MDNHEKLSDVEAKTNYCIPRIPTTFAKAYPDIESLQVAVTLTGDGCHGEYTDSMNERTFRSIINCRNPRCYGGGIDIGRLVHDMTYRKIETKIESYGCRGKEGSAKGKKIHRSCLNGYRVDISIKYKQPPHQPNPTPAP